MKSTNRLSVIATMAVMISLPAFGKDAPPTPPAAIELLFRKNTTLDMPVNINKMKGTLMVDTGAMATHLNKNLAQDLRVNLEDTWKQSEGVGGVSDIMSGEITAYVPGHRPQDFPTLSGKHEFVPMSQETQVTSSGRNFGVIGLPELAAAGAVIDCAGSCITLHPKGLTHRPKGDFKLPMLRYVSGSKMLRRFLALLGDKDLEASFLWALPVTIAGKQGVMIVDTGAEGSFITNSFAKRVGIELGNLNVTALGADGSQVMKPATLPDLLLGGQLQLGEIQVFSGDFPSCRDAAGGNLPCVGILGIDQLRRIKAFFDCKRGIIYAPRAPLKANRPKFMDVETQKQSKPEQKRVIGRSHKH
jgi:Aspartyl protease